MTHLAGPDEHSCSWAAHVRISTFPAGLRGGQAVRRYQDRRCRGGPPRAQRLPIGPSDAGPAQEDSVCAGDRCLVSAWHLDPGAGSFLRQRAGLPTAGRAVGRVLVTEPVQWWRAVTSVDLRHGSHAVYYGEHYHAAPARG